MTDLQPLLQAIEQGLEAYTAPAEGCPRRLGEAMRYSVLAPGKRLRPLLALLACEAVGGEWSAAVPVACAIEFVHVYSLIHDDLPAMDNDVLRRGRATCHIQYDEATAILAGDSLQMLAVETICRETAPEIAVRCCQILSRAAGRCRLVGGQADDLAAEGRFGPVAMQDLTPLEFLKSIHRRKTSALIEASLQLGGVVGGASSEHLGCLSDYGKAIGLAFQIVDDCLDVESTAEQLGKNTHKDSDLGKLTYPSLLGLQGSRELAERLIRDACDSVAVFKERASRLVQLAQFVVERKV
ncbi:MAG: polyprenyl synthetase family protein [Planctomycetales bacterium]|nr:polyprenyl synthetase family protein [Planctomycetales bacterium]